jgi:protein tyrosine phosphatase (PTP) superfamily phosphohydrolase (DUF442 family)
MNSIKSFVQITDEIGTSGQPTRDQFRIIAEAGYKVVVNLAMPDHVDSLPDEGKLVTQLGMNYINIAVPFDNPKPAHVKYFCEILKSEVGQKVYVHCILNYRASAFMYHYLNKVVGLSHEESVSPMFNEWVPDMAWESLLNWDENKIGL